MFFGKYLRKALTQQELNDAVFAHERFLTRQTGGIRAKFASAKLDRLSIANRNLAETDFSFASLVGAVAYGSNLDRSKLVCADLRDCDLRSTSLRHVDMRGVSVCGATLTFAKLDGANLRESTVKYKGPGAGKNSEAMMRVDFSNASLRGASFANANLTGVNFSGAILDGTNFKNVRLSNVCFKGAVLIDVNLADLAVPPEALQGCVLGVTEESAAKASMLAAKVEEHQLCVVSDGQRGKQATLDGEDLRPLAQQFADKMLTGLSARGAVAIGVDFTDCQLQGARFEGADLRACKFKNADLRGACFRGAQLSHAEFENADLRNLVFPNGKKQAPDFSGSVVSEIQFIKANLETGIDGLGLDVAA